MVDDTLVIPLVVVARSTNRVAVLSMEKVAVLNTEKVAHTERKVNPTKDTARALLDIVVAAVPMTRVLMAGFMDNRPVTAKGIMSNNLTIMTRIVVVTNKSPISSILRAIVPGHRRMKGMVDASTTTKRLAPPTAEVMDKKHTVVDTPRLTLVDTKKARIAAPEVVMVSRTNGKMTATSRMVGKIPVSLRDIVVTMTMTTVATMVRIRVTPPRTVKLRIPNMARVLAGTATIATDVVKDTRGVAGALVLVRKVMGVVARALASVRKAMDRVVVVVVRAILLTTGMTKPTVQSASTFATITMMRTITVGRSMTTITVAKTQTIDRRKARGVPYINKQVERRNFFEYRNQ